MSSSDEICCPRGALCRFNDRRSRGILKCNQVFRDGNVCGPPRLRNFEKARNECRKFSWTQRSQCEVIALHLSLRLYNFSNFMTLGLDDPVRIIIKHLRFKKIFVYEMFQLNHTNMARRSSNFPTKFTKPPLQKLIMNKHVCTNSTQLSTWTKNSLYCTEEVKLVRSSARDRNPPAVKKHLLKLTITVLLHD